MIATAAPVKNAKYAATTLIGNPKKNPKAKHSLTSPKPIPRPEVAKKINKKISKNPTPARK